MTPDFAQLSGQLHQSEPNALHIAFLVLFTFASTIAALWWKLSLLSTRIEKLEQDRFKNAPKPGLSNGHGALFTGWQDLPASGIVDRDGLLLCTSALNTDMNGYTSGVRRFADSKRDKYGQGVNTALMPVMEGETYNIQGAEQVWFMGLPKFNIHA